MSLTVKVLIAVVALYPAAALDCAATNSCTQESDDTSLVQVKQIVTRGSDRQGPLLDDLVDPLYDVGAGYDGYGVSNAAPIAGADELAVAHQMRNDVGDARISAALDDTDAAEAAGAQEYDNGSDEDTYANLKTIDARDATADAREYVAATNAAARERAFAANNAERVIDRNAVSDARYAAAADRVTYATDRKDDNEARAAANFDAAEAARVSNAEAAANARWERRAEQEGYADDVRKARAETVAERVGAANDLRDAARYERAQRVEAATEAREAHIADMTERHKDAQEARGYEVTRMSSARRNAREANAFTADDTATDIKAAAASRAMNERENANIARATVAERRDAAKAAAAATAYEAHRDAKEQHAADLAYAAEVSGARKLAAASTRYENRQAALGNAADIHNARQEARYVDLSNQYRHKQVGRFAGLLKKDDNAKVDFAEAMSKHGVNELNRYHHAFGKYRHDLAKEMAALAKHGHQDTRMYENVMELGRKDDLKTARILAGLEAKEGDIEVSRADRVVKYDGQQGDLWEKLAHKDYHEKATVLDALKKMQIEQTDRYGKATEKLNAKDYGVLENAAKVMYTASTHDNTAVAKAQRKFEAEDASGIAGAYNKESANVDSLLPKISGGEGNFEYVKSRTGSDGKVDHVDSLGDLPELDYDLGFDYGLGGGGVASAGAVAEETGGLATATASGTDMVADESLGSGLGLDGLGSGLGGLGVLDA